LQQELAEKSARRFFMKVGGACSCGAIRVEAEADPEKTQLCHCADCQTATGTAFRVSVPVSGASLKVTGQPAIYIKTTADSGRPARAGVLWHMRLADLFDDGRRRHPTVLHAAGRHLAPARRIHAAAANLVALGAAVGEGARQRAARREANVTHALCRLVI
jgi:hypothetical protein